MSTEVIFETQRLLVRKLVVSDLKPFHEMQSNPKVMQYADGEVKSLETHEAELKDLIDFYEKENNDFWIYAIERKLDDEFIGTLALVKDDQKEDEIGFRFLEKYWGFGYGFEICKGLILYSNSIQLPKLVGYVVDVNIASGKILEKCNFKVIEKGIEPISKLPETKYELIL
tara:strand:- start:71458 stop:71970 length:513 start_codon:yes stop_codon:yes gene_type:complete